MRNIRKIAILAVILTPILSLANSDVPSTSDKSGNPAYKTMTDSIFYQEAKLVENMHKYTPVVETYVQEMKADADLGRVPVNDHYFLGRLSLDQRGINDRIYGKKSGNIFRRALERLNSFYKMNYLPQGFMQLIFLNGFDKDHYQLNYQRQEFLGQVRTMVFDVVPLAHQKGVHFKGRIWVETQDHNIVRLNGTYEPQAAGQYYFHFDSWRINVQPGIWLPAYVYTEDSAVKYDLVRKISMKSQTRLWGYDLKHSGRQSEFTDIQIDSPNQGVADETADSANEMNPVASQHKWQREAEDNVLDRMERAGVLAPDGQVSKVLETVVNNLEITNNLNIEPGVRCRVLLTTPLESFTVGNTIVVSRGLLDVLPDEASLAMVLSHELAHVALGHAVNTQYAFSDETMFPDEEVLRRLGMQRSDADEEAANKKAIAMLRNSPYKDKLAGSGLFLKSLEEHSKELSALINPNFGNRIAKGNEVLRMAELAQSAPELHVRDMNQLAALPLGSRIKLDPWDDQVAMEKNTRVPLYSARDKMPFEVTPVFPNLVLAKPGGNEVAQKQ